MTSVSSSTSTAATSSTTSSTSTSSSSSISKDEQDFLKLLSAELQNQDPTNPTDMSSYESTINQYYSLQQQSTTNSNLSDILTLLQGISSSVGATSSSSTTASSTTATAS